MIYCTVNFKLSPYHNPHKNITDIAQHTIYKLPFPRRGNSAGVYSIVVISLQVHSPGKYLHHNFKRQHMPIKHLSDTVQFFMSNLLIVVKNRLIVFIVTDPSDTIFLMNR